MYWVLEMEKLDHELLIKQAEKDRLAAEVLAEAHQDTYNPTLAWVGHRMMHIGMSLVKLAGAEKQPADLN